MKFKITSKVKILDMEIKHEHIQEFKNNSNVFGRIYEYHQYMYKTFPKKEFELLKAEEIK